MSTAHAALLCPRCRNELAQTNASSVGMSVCDLCGGVWLDNQGTARIMAAIHTDAVRVAKEAAQGAFAAAPTEQMIRCPQCSAQMERIQAGDTDVVVDRCAQHGTWFDRNELILASNLAEQQRQVNSTTAVPNPPASSPGAPRPGGPPRPGGAPRPGQASGDLVRKILR